MEITSEWWKTMEYAVQQVVVRRNSLNFYIACKSGCDPPFGNSEEMFFKGICETAKCPHSQWKWSLYKVPFDDDLQLSNSDVSAFELISDETGTLENFAVAKAHVEHNTIYVVALYRIRETGKSLYKFKTGPHFDMICHVTPAQGYIRKTKFSFDCDKTNSCSHFRMLSADNQERVSQYDSSWEYLEFIALKYEMVYMRCMDYDGSGQNFEYDPRNPEDKLELLESDLSQEEIIDILHGEPDSVKNMIIIRDYAAALKKMSFLSSNIAGMYEHFGAEDNTINELMWYLEEIPLDKLVNIQKTSAIMSDFTTSDIPFDSNFMKEMSNFCRNIAERFKNLVEVDRSFASQIDLFLDIFTPLMDCCMIGTSEDEMVMVPRYPSLEVTTVEYMLNDSENNTETYPDYFDDTEVIITRDRYINMTKNYIASCHLFGETVLINEKEFFEEIIKIMSNKYEVFIIRNRGRYFEKIQGLNLIDVMFSRDIYTSSKIFGLAVCATTRDMFWWDKSIPVSSDVLTISVTEEFEVHHFNDPFKMAFLIVDEMREIYPPASNVIQPLCLAEKCSFVFSDGLPTHVIAVRAGVALVVEFLDLMDDLDVTVSYAEIPTLSHFREKTVKISMDMPFLVDNEIFLEDNFKLVAVKPSDSEENVENTPIEYQMRAYTVSCIKWDETKTVWNYTCWAEYDAENERLTCSCDTLSTITASRKQIPMKNWQNYLELKIYLKEKYSLNVNIFIAMLFLLYCLFACFGTGQDDYSKAIYFLSDVIYRSRFGYLIVLKTGRKCSPSTTSNVVIRLRGSKATSEPHVLNYPDPAMKILQNNKEDWFFLATDHNLGILLEIELWFDGVGVMPDWKCKRVMIYDFQKRKWYNSNEACTFSIYPKPKVYAKFSLLDSHATRNQQIGVAVFRFMLRCLHPPCRLFDFSLSNTNESLSYFKRLTLMLSMISSIAIFCMMFYGLPHKDPTDSIMLFWEFQITKELFLNGIYASLSASTFHVPILYLFMISKVQTSNEPSWSKKKLFLLTIICWIVLHPIIIFNLTFLVYNGVWYPDVTSQVWMASVGFGILFYIFVIETICYDIEKLFVADKEIERYVKKQYHIIIKNIELQRKTLYIIFGKFLLRPFLQHLYEPLRGFELKMLWFREKMKFCMKQTVETIVTFVLYVSLLYVIITMNKDSRLVYSNKQVRKLMSGVQTESFLLKSVISVKTLERYLEETLIQLTQSQVWYDGYALRNPGMSIDYNNKMLGVVRIRQFRAESRSCDVLEQMKFLNRTCYSNYFDSQSYRNFGIKWDENSSPPFGDRMKDAWTFASSKTAGTSPTLGKLGYYSGGGYVAFLGRSMRNSLYNLEYLKKYSWIDNLTRGIFIEFLLYNVNINVFNAVTLMIEINPSGYLKKEVQVATSRILLLSQKNLTLVSIIFLSFVILVTAFSTKTFLRIRRTGVWYFKDLHHIIDFSLVFLSVLCIFMFYYREKTVEDFLKSLEGADPKQFVHYSSLMNIDYSFTVISSILIMIGTIKLWSLFRFIMIFKVFEKTFVKCNFPLCAAFAYHFLAFLAFTLCGYILFVDSSYSFEGIINSFESLTVSILQLPEVELSMMSEPSFGFGYIFYVTYILTTILFSCIYSAIIILFYRKAVKDLSNAKEVYSVSNCVYDQFKFLLNFLRVRVEPIRLRNGSEQNHHHQDDGIDLVNPKSDELLYARSLTLNAVKFRAMSLVGLCVLKKLGEEKRPLTQHDILLMTYTLYYLKKMQKPSEGAEGSDKRFYKVRMGKNKARLISERDLTRMRIAVSLLLGESRQDIMRKLHLSEAADTIEENFRIMRTMNAKLENLNIVRNIKMIEMDDF